MVATAADHARREPRDYIAWFGGYFSHDGYLIDF
jgi:hypothetical protein